jgi:hypothetical protein
METTIFIDTYDKPFVYVHDRKIFLDCTYEGEYKAHRKLMVREGIKPAVIAHSIANTFLVPVDSKFVKCLMQVINQFL